MQLPNMCLSPLRKCHRGKTLPSRIERVSRTLAKDFVSWSSVRTGSGASGKSPSILFTKASGRFFTSITEAYLNRVSSASSENCHSSPLGESLLYARNGLLLSKSASVYASIGMSPSQYMYAVKNASMLLDLCLKLQIIWDPSVRASARRAKFWISRTCTGIGGLIGSIVNLYRLPDLFRYH